MKRALIRELNGKLRVAVCGIYIFLPNVIIPESTENFMDSTGYSGCQGDFAIELIISANKTLPVDLTVSVVWFPFSGSEFVIPLCCRISGVEPCTCKEYIYTYNSWLLFHVILRP